MASHGGDNSGAPLKYMRADIRCRPRRPLILIDDEMGWPDFFRAMEFASALWGGWYSAIAPWQPELLAHFLPLIRLFDPDDILSTKRREEVPEEVDPLLKPYVNPFPPPDGHRMILGIWADADTANSVYGYCPLARSAEQLSLDTVANLEIDSDDTPLVAWISSHTGGLPRPSEEQLTSPARQRTPHATGPKIEQCPLSLSIPECRELLRRIGSDVPSRETNPPFPFEAGLRQLDLLRMSSTPLWADTPLIIIGEDVADLCLYHNLLRVRGNVFWLPNSQGEGGNLARDAYTEWCRDRIHDLAKRHRNMPWELSSISELESLRRLDSEQLETEIDTRGILSQYQVTLREPTDTLGLVAYDRCLVEAKWRASQDMPVRGGRALTEIPTPVPDFAEPPVAGVHGWAADIQWKRWSCAPIQNVVVEREVEADWDAPARAGRHSLSYPSFGGITVTQHAQTNMRQPLLELPNGEEIAIQKLKGAGIETQGLSDTGRYERATVEMFGGPEGAASVLRDAAKMALLNWYRKDKFVAKEDSWYFQHGVAYIDRCKAEQLVKAATDTNSTASWDLVRPTVQDWLELGVLQHGTILKCPICSYCNWYSLDDLSQVFRCARCNRANQVDAHFKPYWRLYEPIRQALQHNSDVPILAIHTAGRHAWGAITYSTALNILGDDKSMPGDLDLFMVVRGQLWIGEAKSADAKLSQKDIKRLRKIADRLKPDVLLLVTGQSNWLAVPMQERFTKLTQQLIKQGTQVVTMSRSDLQHPHSFHMRMWRREFIATDSSQAD